MQDIILLLCVSGKGQRNYTNTSFMEGGKRVLKLEQSEMAFVGFFLAEDSLHLKLLGRQMRFYHVHIVLSFFCKCAQNTAVSALPNLRLYQF